MTARRLRRAGRPLTAKLLGEQREAIEAAVPPVNPLAGEVPSTRRCASI